MGQRKPETGNSTKRPVVGLNQRLEKKLISYALAAGAAGVGAMAFLPRAEAEVVFTKTWVPITPNTSITNLDLNNDGIVDFTISNFNKSCSSNSRCFEEIMNALAQNSGNAVWGTNSYAAALGSGVSVGSKGKFEPGHQFMGSEQVFGGTSGVAYNSRGQWRQTTNRYLGLKFIIQGEVHYGWVRMDVAAALGGMYAAVSGYAYETVPNTPILTGQKSGAPKETNSGKKGSASVDVPAPTQGDLGTLAIGALGLQSSRGPDVPRK
jgi:hypothetical protein